jgi:hypothetical protein
VDISAEQCLPRYAASQNSSVFTDLRDACAVENNKMFENSRENSRKTEGTPRTRVQNDHYYRYIVQEHLFDVRNTF